MSFIFDGTKAASPERQRIAHELLKRRQQQGIMAGPTAMPTDIGGGLQALGEGILGGLEDRSLMQQASGPTDAWADMRQTGQQMPSAGNSMGGGWGFGANALRRLFG